MPEYTNVFPETAAEMIRKGECHVIDVRTPEEHARHRICGAHLLPIQELQQRHGEIPRHSARPLLFVCEHGVRSVKTCSALAQNGWTNLINMTGGMAQWLKSGLPVTSGPATDSQDLRPPTTGA
jgi:rhodanese-related sulfurtransferase